MTDPSHQPSPVPVSFGTAASQGQFHPGNRAGLGTGIPALLILCLLVTVQDVPVQSRKDSGGQYAGDGTEHGTDIFSLCQMVWHDCNPMLEYFSTESINFQYIKNF